MKVKILKIHHDAAIPKYATDGAGCFDLYAIEGGNLLTGSVILRTGLAFEVPKGWAMMIYSRSGHGFKSGVRLSNCVGVIDSDYRAEVLVKLSWDEWKRETFVINPGDRIAQAMLVPVEPVEFEEVHTLSETARGLGGFGSTGA